MKMILKKLGLLFIMMVIISTSAVFANGDAEEGGSSGKTAAVLMGDLPDGVVIPAELPKYRIGVSYRTFADKLGSQFKESLLSLSDMFNVEFVFIEGGMSQEAGQANFENALTSGLDGMLVVSLTVANAARCQSVGVPVVQFSSELSTDVLKQLAQNDMYLGNVADHNFGIGFNSAQALYDAGTRKIGVAGLSPGRALNHDERIRGFKAGVERFPDMEIIAEDYSLARWAESIASFAAAYPEMDGIFSSASSEQVFQTINLEGLIGHVKFATADVSESTEDYLDNGTLVYIAGGQYGTIMGAFAVLYNYIYNETRLISNPSEVVYREHIEVRNTEDFEQYKVLVDGEVLVYTPNEIASMIVGFNSNYTEADFRKMCKDYSIQDLVSRHAILVSNK